MVPRSQEAEIPKLTKRLIDSLNPRATDYVVWDADVKGFGARVRPSGRITYILKYRVRGGRGGVVRKPAIGRHGAVTVDQARAIARQWLAEVARGGDPSAQRGEARAGPTVAALAERYLREHAEPYKKPSSVAEDRRLIEKRINPAFGMKKAQAVSRADVARLHGGLRSKPYEGNRTLALVSKMMALAESWGHRPDASNPCRHIKKFAEAKRERFLSEDELGRLGAVLATAEREGTESKAAIAAIRLLAVTGCRRGEILTLEWAHVDFENGCLRLPQSKTGPKIVYLAPAALEILQGIERQDDNPFVIVGAKPATHLVNLTKSWARLRKLAGLDGVRIHDLRHGFAAIGAAGGLSLPVLGKLLGHAQPGTTARYAHVVGDPLRKAAAQVGRQIAAAMRGQRGEVVELSAGKKVHSPRRG